MRDANERTTDFSANAAKGGKGGKGGVPLQAKQPK
jgi:hypothetical protein